MEAQLPFRRPLPVIVRSAVALEIFLGIGALFGGGQFILAPDGHLLGMSTSLLAGSPFDSYLLPGIILFGVVGIGPLVVAAMTIRRQRLAPVGTIAVGLALIGWISVDMVVLAGPASLAWTLYLLVGAAICALGLYWWHSSD